MTKKTSSILISILLLIISLVLAQAICLFITDDLIFGFFSPASEIPYIASRLFGGAVIFFIFMFFKNMKISKVQIHIMGIAYFFLLVSAVLFKSPLSYNSSRPININPISSIMDLFGSDGYYLSLISLGNFALFVPAGLYFSYLAKAQKKVMFGFLFISISLEAVQLIFKLGVFDTFDIITTFLGLLTGFGIHKYISQKKGKGKNKEDVF